MLGAICGDVIGRPYEFEFPVRTKDFPLFRHDSRFSDDTILTAAITKAAMDGLSYEDMLVEFGLRHLEEGFAKGFKSWLLDESRKQGDSYGNGSAMRVTGLPWLAADMDETIRMATESALPSHSHPEGIKGAVAVAVAVRLSIEGRFGEIKRVVTELTGYDLNRSVDAMRWTIPRFKTTCQDSVPEAIICALEATSYEDAVRNAVSLGNDADTQACIAGAIVEPLYGVPENIASRCLSTLTPDLREVYKKFLVSTHTVRHPDGRSRLAGGYRTVA
jgi:ADP-ribosylglycohydrolase